MRISVGPFLLETAIARGGMGEVWRATLGPKGPMVAIKLLMNERLVDSRFLSAFDREVRAVSRLNHPQIVRVHDFGWVTEEEAEASEGRLLKGLPWLAMEMATGGALSTHCGLLKPPEVERILIDLLGVLAHAHARDVIHRDLKPGNVLLRRVGSPAQAMVLTDFGLAHMASRGLTSENLEGGWLGTTSYMAPEQFDLDANRIGPWTDLYGFGCLAWCLICGEPPFGNVASPEMVRVAQILHEPPRFEPKIQVPEGVELWLRRLLQKDPNRRFGWAVEAAEALKGILKGQRVRPYNFPMIQQDWRSKRVGELSHELKTLGGTGLGLVGIRSIPMVGREDERDALWAALNQVVQTNKPLAIVLEGPAGCGKSRLAAWLSERADEELGAVRLKVEHGPLSGPEDGLLPSLRRHSLTKKTDWDEPNTANERYTQIRDHVAHLTSCDRPEDALRPVIIWIDNLQWALDAIGFVKHFLGRRDESQWPVLILMTARREVLSEERVVRVLVDDLLTEEDCASLPIERLPEEHRATLVRELLGLEASLAAEVERRTGGIPHFTFQLVGDWVERGLLEVGDGGFRLKEGVSSEMPDDLYAVWMGRIRRGLDVLPTSDAIALEMAAMMGHRVETEEWKAICYSASCPPTDNFLSTLQGAGILDIGPGGLSWSFSNAMVAECLVRLSKEAGRWATQNRLCAELLEHGKGPLVTERRGLHLLEAGEWEQALEPLLEASILRRDRSDYHVAMQLLDARDGAMDSLGLPELDRRRVISWVDRARLARVEQHLEIAEEWVKKGRRVATLGGYSDLLLRIEREAAYNALTRGDYRQATEQMSALLEQAELADDQEIIGACHLGLISVRMSKGRVGDALLHAEKALEVFVQLGNISGQGHAYRGMGWALLTSGKLTRAREQLIIAQERYAKAGLKYGLAEVRNDLGEVYRLQGGYGVAESLYRSSIDLYRSIGAAQILTPRVNLAFALLDQERLDEASVLLEDCLDASRQQGRKAYEAASHLGLGLGTAKQGNWDKCMAHVVWARMILEEVDLVVVEHGRLFQRVGELALAAEEQGLAKECLSGAKWHWVALEDADAQAEVERLLSQ
jgi:serine/threonine protein kinase/tetratricopeptide (TPR) repeat protein